MYCILCEIVKRCIRFVDCSLAKSFLVIRVKVGILESVKTCLDDLALTFNSYVKFVFFLQIETFICFVDDDDDEIVQL